MKYCKNHTHFPTNHKPRLLLLASISLLLCVTFYHAEAAETLKGKGLGIIIEKPVILSGKLYYKDILYFDNSLKQYSGDFIPNGDDIKRKSTPYKNQLGYYKYDKSFRIFIDPPLQIKQHLPLITIVSQLDEFHIKGQNKVTEIRLNNETKPIESIRTYSHTRHVDISCTNAIITVKNWKILLQDTIDYLRANCSPGATKIKTLSTDVNPLIKHNLSESYKWKLDTWKQEIIKSCLKQRNACTDLKQPSGAGQ